MISQIKRTLVHLLIGFVLLLLVSVCSANEGAFDSTFPGGGRLVVDISTSPHDDHAVRLIARPDGKFLMAAYCYYTDNQNVPRTSFCVTQLLASGAYDSSFGPAGAGYVQLSRFATWPGDPAELADMIVLQDGRIVLLGGSTDPSDTSTKQLLLGILKADGSALDTTVGGGNGYLALKFGGLSSVPGSLVQQPDGKLLIGGSVTGVNGNSDFAVTRFLANLSGPDTAFASGGTQIVAFDLGGAAGSDNDICTAVRLQSNGKIVLAGAASDTPASYMSAIYEFALVRLNTDGSRDLSFGSASDGRVHYSPSPNARVSDARIDASDRIVLAGEVGPTTTQWIIDRLSANGTPDVRFNNGNPQIFSAPPGGNGFASRIALTNDGIFVIGTTERESSQYGYFSVARLDSNGAFDMRFGTGGHTYGSFTATNDVSTLAADISVTTSGLLVFGTQTQSFGSETQNKFGIGRLQYDQIFANDFGLNISVEK